MLFFALHRSFVLKKNYFILEYSRLTTLWSFQVESKGTQPYINMYPLHFSLEHKEESRYTITQMVVFKESQPFAKVVWEQEPYFLPLYRVHNSSDIGPVGPRRPAPGSSISSLFILTFVPI